MTRLRYGWWWCMIPAVRRLETDLELSVVVERCDDLRSARYLPPVCPRLEFSHCGGTLKCVLHRALLVCVFALSQQHGTAVSVCVIQAVQDDVGRSSGKVSLLFLFFIFFAFWDFPFRSRGRLHFSSTGPGVRGRLRAVQSSAAAAASRPVKVQSGQHPSKALLLYLRLLCCCCCDYITRL